MLLAIGAGGALGAPARVGVTHLVAVPEGTFPWATFGTNVTGSLVLGMVLVLLVERFTSNTSLRPFVTTGFLGAYTTFSTLALDTDLLVRGHHAAIAALYSLGTMVAGLGAVVAGMRLARRITIGPVGAADR